MLNKTHYKSKASTSDNTPSQMSFHSNVSRYSNDYSKWDVLNDDDDDAHEGDESEEEVGRAKVAQAANEGDLDQLKSIRAKHPPWWTHQVTKALSLIFAKHGHLDCLKWLDERGVVHWPALQSAGERDAEQGGHLFNKAVWDHIADEVEDYYEECDGSGSDTDLEEISLEVGAGPKAQVRKKAPTKKNKKRPKRSDEDEKDAKKRRFCAAMDDAKARIKAKET